LTIDGEGNQPRAGDCTPASFRSRTWNPATPCDCNGRRTQD